MALPSNVGYPVPQLDCLSWRLAVETNNLQNWKTMTIALSNTKFIEWLAEGKLPVIPSIQGVYKTLGGNDSKSAVEYKSSKRMEWVKGGYRIGNIGDQWTDLIGENVGARTFKVPNPMYYVG
ncbi:hypothetical protein KY284_027670 [Solanum tuberosum]|nr:hypothetical protein KY284_027670 [Solanum tuberosum]